MWKKHINSSIAGIFTVTQLVLTFFFAVEGIFLLRLLGYIIWLISLLFGIGPIIIFKKSGDVQAGKSYIRTQKMVTGSLYGIIRHPQYLAGPLLNAALMLISQHWLIILLGIPAIILIGFDLKGADQEGLEKFGDEYRTYMQEVPKINFLAGIYRKLKK